MSDVFISYSRKDRAKAQAIAELCEAYGWSVWWDREIPAGRSFDNAIQQALDTARCVIVLWSENSVVSDWVKNEAHEGMQRGILLPVLLESVRMPLAFRHLQTCDLSQWRGKEADPEVEELIEAVRAIVKPSAAVIPRKPRRIAGKPHVWITIACALVGIAIVVGWRLLPPGGASRRDHPATPTPVVHPTESPDALRGKEDAARRAADASSATPDLRGSWAGSYSYVGAPLPIPITIEFKQSDGVLAGQMASTGLLGTRRSEIRDVTVTDGREVKFTVQHQNSGEPPVGYKGKLSSDGQSIRGTWTIMSQGLNGSFELHRN